MDSPENDNFYSKRITSKKEARLRRNVAQEGKSRVRIAASCKRNLDSENELLPDAEFFQGCVPQDFPRRLETSGLGGMSPKFSAVLYRDKFYLEGDTPPELYSRWQHFETLAEFFARKCRDNESGKYQHLSRAEIMNQYCGRLLETDWGTKCELKWVIRRAACLLDWPTPPNAQ